MYCMVLAEFLKKYPSFKKEKKKIALSMANPSTQQQHFIENLSHKTLKILCQILTWMFTKLVIQKESGLEASKHIVMLSAETMNYVSLTAPCLTQNHYDPSALGSQRPTQLRHTG